MNEAREERMLVKDFVDKVVVITGAGSGIGSALAIEFAKRGATLALSDVDERRTERVAERCTRLGATARSYELDVSNRDAFLVHADEVKERFGNANLVVNNAGVALVGGVAEMSWEQLEWIVGINFWGVVHGTKAFLPQLIASGHGHIVNMSSVFGLVGFPKQSGYNATKFAVRGFTEALRQEMLIDGSPVGVSCVHPGGIKTNIAKDARAAEAYDTLDLAQSFNRIAWTGASKAAKTIVRGIEGNRAKILIGADAAIIDKLPRLLGSGYQRITAYAARRGLR